MKRWLILIPLVAALPQTPDAQGPPAVFHAGTRLVEVEVVVRDKRIRPPGLGNWLSWTFDIGPPFGPPGEPHEGLAKDDFSLLDQGKPQEIAVFRAGSAPSSAGASIPAPPGFVANRRESAENLKGTTAILVDFLNTGFGLRGYERYGVVKFLRSFSASDERVALYTLGTSLHVLHDFTEDPQKLIDIAATLESHPRKLDPNLAAAFADFGDTIPPGDDDARPNSIHGPATVQALGVVLQHLAGIPGRKNLIWVIEDAARVPPPVIAMAVRAKVVVYPVLVRLAGSEVSASDAERLASATGGRAYFDALDMGFAMRVGQEEARHSYALGYYPPDEMLDGKYHKIKVAIRNKQADRDVSEIHYRAGYVATKIAEPPLPSSVSELFHDTLELTDVGIVGQAVPSSGAAGSYDVHLLVDLHDLHIESKDGVFTGSFDLLFLNASQKDSYYSSTVDVNLTDKELADSLQNGFPVLIKGVTPQSGEVRIAIRDHSTGVAGSLRIPVSPHTAE